MRREAPIPSGFEGLTGKIQYVQRKTANEYSSSCPECGGVTHQGQGGEWPDRFRMFTTDKIRGWCRKCDYLWWPDMNEPDWRPDAEEIARRAKAAEERLQLEIEKAQSTLSEMRQARAWLEYHEQLTPNARAQWLLRGLGSTWVDWWQLGYNDNFDMWRKDGDDWEKWWTTPTLTIPIWGNDWQVNNIKHRLLNVPPKGGKYQQEKRGIPAAPFLCDPDRKDGMLMIAEGEIKAMVTFATIDSPSIQVAGIPTVTPSQDMIDSFAEYDPVYICLDPDGFQKPSREKAAPIDRVAEMVGARARIVELPDKIDDLILAGHLDKDGIRRAFKRARKI